MKLLVLGAGGRTGAAVVEQAVQAGHEVTVFVHEAKDETPAGVRKVVGDAEDAGQVNAAVAGQDAVVDAVGGSTPYKQTTLERSVAQHVVAAMRTHGVRRLVAISMLGEGDSKENTPFLYEHLLLPTYLRGANKDKAAMEAEVESSGLDWVIVRPAILTDDGPTGDIKVFRAEAGDKANKIARADVAAFILKQLTSADYLGQAVTIATS